MKLNPAYRGFFKGRSARYNVLFGGAGSAKSYSMAQKVVLSCADPNKRWLVVRKVGATIKDSVFALLKEVIREEDITCHYNQTDKTITFPNGSEIICKGLDDPEKIKSIHGVTDCWVEEASELKEADFKQLNLRLRGKGIERHFYLTFNPIDENHWLKGRFFDNQDEDAKILHTTYKDNAFLDEEYKAELESYRDKDPYYYQVYCLGEWGRITGHRILRNVRVEAFEPDPARRRYHGLDFGFHDPNAATESYIYDGSLYICREWVQPGLDPNDMLAEMDALPWLRDTVVTADSARPEIIRMMKTNGYKVQGAKKRITGNKLERKYKFAMAQFLMAFDNIYIHPDCPITAREFQGWAWDQDRDGNPQRQPKDGDDHTIDATIYALERAAEAYYRRRQ